MSPYWLQDYKQSHPVTATSAGAWKVAIPAGTGVRCGDGLGAGWTEGTLAGFCGADLAACLAGGTMASTSAFHIDPCRSPSSTGFCAVAAVEYNTTGVRMHDPSHAAGGTGLDGDLLRLQEHGSPSRRRQRQRCVRHRQRR